MTFVAAMLQAVGQLLAAALLIFMLLFIAGACVMVWLCSIFRTQPNGYAQRFRLPKDREPWRRPLKVTPDRDHPEVVGDVTHVTQARFPASRANVRRGEG